MEELYCNSCKDYTDHETIGTETFCSVCKEIYDRNKKRYIICGPADDVEVLKSRQMLLDKDPGVIIIDEAVALKHKLGGLPMNPKDLAMNEPFILKNYNREIEDLKYSYLSKKEREADIQPVRTEPKIRRNDLCPCGSGEKYKKCCSKKS
jgi:hypothetical protein